MALKGNTNEWVFSQMRYTEQKLSAFRNEFLKKYRDRLDHARINKGYHKMRYRSKQPVKRYIYNHTHYHRAMGDLGDNTKYKESIQDSYTKELYNPANKLT